jgi:hypothetical protein
MKPGPKPAGERALTGAERMARLRANQAQGVKPVHYRRPVDRRSRPQQWADAIGTLAAILDGYETWRDRMPAGLEGSTTAERLDELLALRDLIEQLKDATLPRGFGRD